MISGSGSKGVQRARGTKVLCGFLALLMLGVWGVAGTPTTAGAAVPPPPPTGLSPNGSSVQGNPTLSWNTSPGATSYKVTVQTSPGGVAINGANNQTVYSNNFDFQTDLGLGDYTWNVVAVGPGGTSSATSGSFTKQQVNGPTLSSPADGATINYPSQSPTLSWTSVTGVKSYKLEISTDSGFSQALTTSYVTQATSYTITTTPSFGTTYYWRVTGTFSNSNVNTAASAPRWYIVKWGASGLASPQQLSPSDNTLNSIHDVVLKWEAVPGAASYEVQVSPSQDFSNLSFDISTDATLYAPAEGLDNGTYYWRVRATTNEGAQSVWSSTWAFRRVPMAKVSLLSPANSPMGSPTQVRDLFLSWNPVPEASAYQVEVGSDPNFSNETTSIVCVTNHTNWGPYLNDPNSGMSPVGGPGGVSACPLNKSDLRSMFSFPSSDGVTLYWRVRGLDSYKTADLPPPWNSGNQPINGPWSDTWSFQYRADLGAPTLVSPANGTNLTVPRLAWTEVPGAEYYVVTIQESNYKWDSGSSSCIPANTSSTKTYKTSSTSFVPSLRARDELPPTAQKCEGHYSWTVQSVNNLEITSPVPPMRSFVFTGYAAGTATSVITPTATQSATRAGDISFSWNAIAGADHYEVRWFQNGGSTFTSLGDSNQSPSAASFFPYTNAYTTTNLQSPGYAEYQILAWGASNALLAISSATPITVSWPTVTLIGPDNCVPSNQSCTPKTSTPMLTWAPVVGASFYRVIIGVDAQLTNKVRQYVTPQSSFRSVESLPDNQAGQAYYWFVQPCRGDWKVTSSYQCGVNETAPGVQIWAFQKRSSTISGMKVLQSTTNSTATPDNACGSGTPATTFSDQPTFCWGSFGGTPADDVAAMTYQIQVATTPNYVAGTILTDAEVDQASYTPYQLGTSDGSYPDGQLYWRVRPRDASGNYLTWTDGNGGNPITKASGTVSLVLPADGATVSSSPSLSWTAKNFAAKYTLEIYKNGDVNASPTNLVRSQVTDLTAYTATQGGNNNQTLPAGTYAWRVRTIDANNLMGAWNTPRTFTVSPGIPTLSTPAQMSPLTAITTPTVHYTWSAVPGAVSYRIQESVNSNVSSPFENKVSYTTSWAPLANVPNGTIYWQVSALDAQNQVLGTSTIGSFVYTSQRPTASTPTGVIGDASVTLYWTASPVAAIGPITSYVLTAYLSGTTTQVTTRTISAATAGPTTGASYTFTGLTNNVAYQFTVTPYDAQGPGTESSKSGGFKPQAYAPFSSQTACIKRLYSDLLGVKTPSPSQISVYVNYMNNSNKSCVDVAANMWQQGPFLDLFPIARLYQAYFLRIPDFGGLDYWIGLHRTRGITTNFMSDFFVQSQEFRETYGGLSNSGYVSLIYVNVLQRPQDPDGFNYWLQKLNTKRINRGQLMLLFSEAKEYKNMQMPTVKAELLVLEFLRRTPTQAEVDHYAPLMPSTYDSAGVATAYNSNVLAQIKAMMSTMDYKSRAN